MFITKNLAILAAANTALALNTHRHGHQHLHQKKDLVVETDWVTVTDSVTVTVYDNGETEPSTKAPAVFVTANHAPVDTPSPTTLITLVAAPSSPSSAKAEPVPTLEKPVEAAVAAVVSTPAPAYTTQAAQPPTGSTPKRGLAYNDPSLLSGFVGSGSKVGWAYNWGQNNDMSIDVEFVPMLWGPASVHSSTWNANANKAIAAGSKCLLSFNEPDNAGQANISPSAAKDAHIEFMNPFQGKARIGAPAVTNSNLDGEGIPWLKQFVSACAGQCAIDFVPVHWYSPADTEEFFNHLRAVRDVVPGKPVWITEFAPFGSDDEINKFLATVVDTLDNDSEFDFVERYSYFMVSPGSLVSSGTSLSVYGETYAYA